MWGGKILTKFLDGIEKVDVIDPELIEAFAFACCKITDPNVPPNPIPFSTVSQQIVVKAFSDGTISQKAGAIRSYLKVDVESDLILFMIGLWKLVLARAGITFVDWGTVRDIEPELPVPTNEQMQMKSTSRGDVIVEENALATIQLQRALLRVYSNGIFDENIMQATLLLADDTLTVNDKLTKIDALIPFPANAFAEQLGEMLGKTKQAVLKTDWWIQKRKGEKDSEVGKRRDLHRKRAKSYEANDQNDIE